MHQKRDNIASFLGLLTAPPAAARYVWEKWVLKVEMGMNNQLILHAYMLSQAPTMTDAPNDGRGMGIGMTIRSESMHVCLYQPHPREWE